MKKEQVVVCPSFLWLGYSGRCPNLLESAASELVQFFEFIDGTFDSNGIGASVLGECLSYFIWMVRVDFYIILMGHRMFTPFH